LLTDFVIQFFSEQPRRERAVFGLLTGKQTISILYAALIHQQLQWLHLYPSLSKEAFSAAITTLKVQRMLRETETGLILTEKGQHLKQAAVTQLPLPTHYQPWMNLPVFAPRFFLGVQVLSEASYANRAYQPISVNWATQQVVKQWYQQVDHRAAVTTLSSLFQGLPTELADTLAANMIGHDYAGQLMPATLQAHFERLDALAALVQQLANTRSMWTALWGGPRDFVSRPAQQTLAQARAGMALPTIAHRSHRKQSTINEHLLLAAIMGETLPIEHLVPLKIHRALNRVTQIYDHQALLAAIPGSTFFQIRLFQILSFQGRWPRVTT
jgi:uncharacterized protein YpbB